MLKEGDLTPDFGLPGDDGRVHTLYEHRGKHVILYFYPKDMTPGCTTQSCDFNDRYETFSELGAVIYGISKDSLVSHARFKSKYGFRFNFLSDPELIVHKVFGAFGEKSIYGRKSMGTIRTTYLIDGYSYVARVWRKVRVKGHVDAVKQALQRRMNDQGDDLYASSIRTR